MVRPKRPLVPPGPDDDARSRLLRAAVSCFASHGLEGATTRDIADAAGLNISLISYYFGGKENLYRAVLEEHAARAAGTMETFQREAEQAELNTARFRELCTDLIRLVVRNNMQSPEMKFIMLREVTSGMPHSKDLFDQVFFKISDQVTCLIERAQALGIFRKEIPAAPFFMSMLHLVDSFISLGRCPVKMRDACFKLPEQEDELAHFVATVLLNGGLVSP